MSWRQYLSLLFCPLGAMKMKEITQRNDQKEFESPPTTKEAAPSWSTAPYHTGYCHPVFLNTYRYPPLLRPSLPSVDWQKYTFPSSYLSQQQQLIFSNGAIRSKLEKWSTPT